MRCANRDPIVEEVRRIRETHAAQFGFDVRAIMEDARKRQASRGHRIVNLEGRPKTRKPIQSKAAALAKKG